MEVFVSRELLTQKARAADVALTIYNEAPVRFMGEERLAKAKNDQGIQTAADESQDECDQDRAAKFSEK